MQKISRLISIIALFIVFISNTGFSKGPGDKADDFSLNGIDGVNYNLQTALENSENGVIVIFWSIECPWVQPYNDRINDYVKDLSDKGFTVWAINANHTESVDEIITHYNKNKYTFPMLKDVNNKVADMLEASRTPESFMIAKDKTILYHGRISDNRNKSDETENNLGNAASDVSGKKEVTVKETKSFGCTIKKIGQDM